MEFLKLAKTIKDIEKMDYGIISFNNGEIYVKTKTLEGVLDEGTFNKANISLFYIKLSDFNITVGQGVYLKEVKIRVAPDSAVGFNNVSIQAYGNIDGKWVRVYRSINSVSETTSSEEKYYTFNLVPVSENNTVITNDSENIVFSFCPHNLIKADRDETEGVVCEGYFRCCMNMNTNYQARSLYSVEGGTINTSDIVSWFVQ